MSGKYKTGFQVKVGLLGDKVSDCGVKIDSVEEPVE